MESGLILKFGLRAMITEGPRELRGNPNVNASRRLHVEPGCIGLRCAACIVVLVLLTLMLEVHKTMSAVTSINCQLLF
jgi:hypothetical protein